MNEYVAGSISSLKVYPGEEAVLEMVMFDLKDLVSSLLMFDAENLLEVVFSLLIRALRAHSLRLNSGSMSPRDCSMGKQVGGL